MAWSQPRSWLLAALIGCSAVSSSRNIGDTLELYIDPECGLKTRTWQEAEAKLRVMVQGVREVKQELGLDGHP